ncbi:hypothetical protein SSX86_010122 [Deinandra increscens subsp. villosa]|uniref:Peptidase C1A papain C-terminal domain-containing protein n=1 Tax=Deinandra increscens subsp. villosa TaxID=3103831 RepID=A0AAP0DEN9_9ASTR
MNTIVTGRRTTLSVQQIMDTTRIASCGQGDPSIAFQHMLLFGGLATEREYPFTGRYGPCKFLTKEVAITGYTRLPEGDEDALQWAVNVGPVVAVIEAGESFAANDTGVHYEMSRIAALNHCVLVVGYGVDETTGREFWIIRNSYGERWGDKGHARVPRNCVVEEGYCNLAHYAIYPTMAGLNPPFLARQVSYPLAMHYSPCPCVACRVLFPNATREEKRSGIDIGPAPQNGPNPKINKTKLGHRAFVSYFYLQSPPPIPNPMALRSVARRFNLVHHGFMTKLQKHGDFARIYYGSKAGGVFFSTSTATTRSESELKAMYEKFVRDPKKSFSEDELMAMYDIYLVDHGKSFRTVHGKRRGFEIFKETVRFCDDRNSTTSDPMRKLGINSLADVDKELISNPYVGRPRPPPPEEAPLKWNISGVLSDKRIQAFWSRAKEMAAAEQKKKRAAAAACG